MDFQGARVKTLSILYKKQDYLITKKTFFTNAFAEVACSNVEVKA